MPTYETGASFTVTTRPTRPIDPDAKRVGAVLRAVRREQGLTQEEVASKLPIGEGAYAAYETGRSRFTLPELPAVARALGVEVTYLARRLDLCGDGSDALAVLAEYAGPEIGSLIATAVRKYPTLSEMQRHFFVHALRSL